MVFTKSFHVGLDERGVLFEEGTPVRLLQPGTHRYASWRAVDVKVFSLATPLQNPPQALLKIFGAEIVTVDIAVDERGVLIDNGVPVRRLDVGRHHFWQPAEVKKFSFATPLGDAPAVYTALLGSEVTTVDVQSHERAVLLERGVPVRRLAPGRHALWTSRDPSVQKFSTHDAIDLKVISPSLRALLAEDITVFDVGEEERVILLQDSVALRVLEPGRHAFWTTKNVAVVRYDTKTVTAELPPAHALLLAAELIVVDVEKTERALVTKKKKPLKLLSSGRHTVWKHKDVDVSVLDFGGIDAVALDAEVRALVAATDYVEVTVPDGAMGVRFVDGAIEKTLPPGRHAAFTIEHQVSIVSIDLRERVATVQGQDIITKDRVTLRVTTSLTWRVRDVVQLVKSAKSPDEILYLAVQLALREQVAQHTLDELLSERALLADSIKPAALACADELGLELRAFGVKDIILPGEMKTLLNKVIEAQKTAEANVIMRREETAAVRSMAQTAKILAENPVLMRLKELEAYKELAEKVTSLNVILGADGSLPKIELKS